MDLGGGVSSLEGLTYSSNVMRFLPSRSVARKGHGVLALIALTLGLSVVGLEVADAAVPCSDDASFWRRSLCSSRSSYLEQVRKARARLWSDPKSAAALCRQAQAIDPQGLEAQLLLAHATLLLGEPGRAYELFEARLGPMDEGTKIPDLEPTVRIAAGRAALLSSHYRRALHHYRRAVLRLEEIPSSRERARVLIEASTAASYSGPGKGREARTALRLASEENAPLLFPIIAAATVLSLYRDGELGVDFKTHPFESSWEIHWLFEGAAPSFGNRREVLPVLPKGESAALAFAVAILVEPEATSLHWDAYWEQSEGVRPPHFAPLREE